MTGYCGLPPGICRVFVVVVFTWLPLMTSSDFHLHLLIGLLALVLLCTANVVRALVRLSFLSCFLYFFIFYLFIYLSRGIQFSRASLNGALTKHKKPKY